MQKLAVIAAVEIIFGPHDSIWTRAADVDAGAFIDVEEERGHPAVHELILGIEATMPIRQEAELIAVFAEQGGGEFFIGPHAERGVAFDEQGQIAEGMGHHAEVVLGARGRRGVVGEDLFAGEGR